MIFEAFGEVMALAEKARNSQVLQLTSTLLYFNYTTTSTLLVFSSCERQVEHTLG